MHWDVRFLNILTVSQFPW